MRGYPRERNPEMAFICGKCKDRHDLAIEARACYEGDLFDCAWLVYVYNEDGRYERACGAPAIATDRGWTCKAGHSHVNLEVQAREGWTYVKDPFEAYIVGRMGVVPIKMDGSGVSEIIS